MAVEKTPPGPAGTTTVEYLYFAGRMIAQYQSGGTQFAHADHLGSTRVMTPYPYTGSVTQSTDYLPFGEVLATAPLATSHLFTGHERDGESGLDYMGARYYTSLAGRFMSADLPFIDQHPTDPQSWNLYAYVRNNPLVYLDPTGHAPLPADPNRGPMESNGGEEAAPTTTIDVETTLESPGSVATRILAYAFSGGNPAVVALAWQTYNQTYNANQGATGRQIARAATASVGSTDWLVATRKGKYGKDTNKCNQFVADMIEAAGLPRPQVPYENVDGSIKDLFKTAYGTRDPTAHEWADPRVSIPGWSDPMSVSIAQPGDVIAQGHGRFGHAGIVVAPGLTVSANTAKNPPGIITQNNWGFRTSGNGERPGDFAPIVRRYVGR